MSAPLVFKFTYRLQDGQLDAYSNHLVDLFTLVDEEEPRLIAMETYLDPDTSEVTTLLVQPDSDAQAHHMAVAGEKLREGYALMDFPTMTIEVLGDPGESVRQVMQGLTEQGVSVTISDRHLGGVNRLGLG